MFGFLRVQGYRGFQDLTVPDLARVNIFVGENNCGKTSLLEAIQIAASSDPWWEMETIARRRGERVAAPTSLDRDYPPRLREGPDIRRFFRGHNPVVEQAFIIDLGGTGYAISFEVSDTQGGSQRRLFGELEGQHDSALGLMFRPLSPSEGASQSIFVVALWSDDDYGFTWKMPLRRGRELSNILFSPLRSDSAALESLYSKVLLAGQEGALVESLQVLERSITQLRFLPGKGFHVTASGNDIYPIGTLGDGVRQMMTISLASLSTSGGPVLLDEVDTGIHHRNMEHVWRILLHNSIASDRQVFCATHSLDALVGLRAFLRSNPTYRDDIAVHRIVREQQKAYRFSGHEMETLVELGMEVR